MKNHCFIQSPGRVLPLVGAAALAWAVLLPWAPLRAAPPATPPAGEFARGNAHYEAGEFAEAAGDYETLLRQGKLSANLAYNLANAYFRLGERGRAVLHYRRALLLQPGHPEAAGNLAFVRRQLGVPGATETAAAAGGWRPGVPAWAGAAAVWTGVLGAWLALGGGIIALWRGLGAGVRRRAAIVGLTAGLPLLLAGAGIGWALGRPAREAARTAVVIARRADARYAPADNAKVAASLTEGNEVRLLLARGPWDYIELADGRRAFIPADRVEPLTPAEFSR